MINFSERMYKYSISNKYIIRYRIKIIKSV